MHPQGTFHQREEVLEGTVPRVEPCLVAQQQVCQQGAPELPLDGVAAEAQEGVQLQGLLDFPRMPR